MANLYFLGIVSSISS